MHAGPGHEYFKELLYEVRQRVFLYKSQTDLTKQQASIIGQYLGIVAIDPIIL
jgi:hypothetical protein